MRETCTDTTFMLIAFMVIELRVFKKKKKMDKTVRVISPIIATHVKFSLDLANFLYTVYCDVTKRRIESKNWNILMYGYNADIHSTTVLCDIGLQYNIWDCYLHIGVLYNISDSIITYRTPTYILESYIIQVN